MLLLLDIGIASFLNRLDQKFNAVLYRVFSDSPARNSGPGDGLYVFFCLSLDHLEVLKALAFELVFKPVSLESRRPDPVSRRGGGY